MVPSRPLSRRLLWPLALAAAVALSACGGGGGGGGQDKQDRQDPTITGRVTAPGGSSGLVAAARRAGEALGLVTPRSPYALAPVAGIPVTLVTVDDRGAIVGTVARTTTSSTGTYAFPVPSGFAPGLRYMVVAETGGSTLRAFATGTTVDVNPYTEVAYALVVEQVQAAGTSLGQIAPEQVVGLVETVQGLGATIDPTVTASQAVADLQAALKVSEEGGGLVASLTEPGGLAGIVTGPGGAPVTGVLVRVLDFVSQTVEATARTDAAGGYSAHVPAGRYTVSVVNDGTVSTAASVWWTAAGGTSMQALADPVDVGTTPVRRDLALPAGGRLAGTVTAEGSGAPLAGIKVTVRRFEIGSAVAPTRTDASGRFALNVPPGDYYLEYLNETGAAQPYASELYRPATNGANNRLRAEKLTVEAGGALTADASLGGGRLLSGAVLDPVTGTSVAGVTVRVTDAATGGGISFARATDRDGSYRMWLRPASYNVLARGQQAPAALDAADKAVSFSAPVGVITAQLVDAGGRPVSGVYGYVHDAATGSQLGWEFSRGDGVLSVYAPPSAAGVRIELRADAALPYGTTIYNGKLQLQQGDVVAVPAAASPLDLGPVTIPWGAIVTGTVRDAAGTPRENTIVSVRSGGTTSTFRLTNVRTRSDGGFTIGLKPGRYDRILAYDPAYAGSISATIAAGPGWAWHDAVDVGTVATPLDFAFRDFHAIDGAVSGVGSTSVTLTLSGPVSRGGRTGADGAYAFAGLPDGTYTVTPSLAGYTFSPQWLTVVVSGADVRGQSFTATPVAPVTHAISGAMNPPTADVGVTLSGAADRATTTDANGRYTFTNLPDGSYTVTPFLAGRGFTPASRPVMLAGADAPGQDFDLTSAAAGAVVSGTVSGLAPGAIAAVYLGGDATLATTTGPAGAYAFPGLRDGAYTVTPSLAGYRFDPVSIAVTVSGADVPGQGFTATAVASPHAIRGAVSGAAGPGVTVTLSGAGSGITTTDSNSQYAFTGLADGTYTVRPSLAGHSFDPPEAQITLHGTDETQSFVAALVTAPPAAPVAATAVPGGSASTLVWTPSPGATAYRVYVGTTLPLAQALPVVETSRHTAVLDGYPLGQRLYYAISAVGPGGEGTLPAARCTVPSAGSIATSGEDLDVYDPLCDDQLHGSRWLSPGGWSAQLATGALELSAAGDDLEPRSLRNAAAAGSASVAVSAGTRVTTLAADVSVPATGVSRTGDVVLRSAIRLLYQPVAVRRSSPEQNQDSMTFEVGLVEAGGGLYAYRNLHHCDTAACGTTGDSGFAHVDPDGLLTIPGTSSRGTAAAYDTTYRVSAALDEQSGVFTWKITGGAFGATGLEGTADPAAYLAATPSYATSTVAPLAAAFSAAQLQSRIHDASLTGGGSGTITARFDNVFAGTNGGAAVAYDDFDGGAGNSGPDLLSAAKWSGAGVDAVWSDQGSANISRMLQSAGAAARVNGGLSLSHPEQYDLFQADLAMPESVVTAGSSAQAYLEGRFYNDGTTARLARPRGDATGDVAAGFWLSAAGGASGYVRRCNDATCSTTTSLGSFMLPDFTAGTGVHTVRVGYSRSGGAFEFGVDGIATTLPAPPGATYVARASAPMKRVFTRVDVPAVAGVPAALRATVNNVLGRPDLREGVGLYCAALDPAGGTSVVVQGVASAPPAATGGTIADGTYRLTALNSYTGAGGFAGATAYTSHQTWVFSGPSLSYAGVTAGPTGLETEKHVSQFGTAGAVLVAVESCPGLGAAEFTYSVSGSELRIYSGPEEYVLTRQ